MTTTPIVWQTICFANIQNYEASNTGLIRSSKNNKVLSIKVRGTYNSAQIVIDGTDKVIHIHLLVASAFIMPLADDDVNTVIHIDGNTKNNNANNLKYAKRIEEWKTVHLVTDTQKYQISTLGNLRSKQGLNYKPMKVYDKMHPIVKITVASHEYEKKVSWLMAHAFIPNVITENGENIEHINNNTKDNRLVNLRYIQPTELWEPVPLNNPILSKLYEVSNTGIVRTIKEKNICAPTKTRKYVTVNLVHKDQKFLCKVDVLVASAFVDGWVDQSNENYDIIHIDGNVKNNRADNLKWRVLTEEEKQEIWKPVNIEGFEHYYQISTLGRIRDLGENLLKCHATEYTSITLAKDAIKSSILKPGEAKKIIVKQTYKLHRLVAITFIPVPLALANIPIEKLDVNHKNGNKHDNRLCNLEWCTRSQNVHHSIHVLKNKGGPTKAVIRIDPLLPLDDPNREKQYNTIVEAKIANNLNRFKMDRKLKDSPGLYTGGRFHWRYVEERIDRSIDVVNDSKFKPIVGYPKYYISNDGIVYSTKQNRPLTIDVNKLYPVVKISKYDAATKKLTSTSVSVHTLVATAYVPNPDNRPYVNHIDHNKHNYHYTNLEWVTASENALKYRAHKREQASKNLTELKETELSDEDMGADIVTEEIVEPEDVDALDENSDKSENNEQPDFSNGSSNSEDLDEPVILDLPDDVNAYDDMPDNSEDLGE